MYLSTSLKSKWNRNENDKPLFTKPIEVRYLLVKIDERNQCCFFPLKRQSPTAKSPFPFEWTNIFWKEAIFRMNTFSCKKKKRKRKRNKTIRFLHFDETGRKKWSDFQWARRRAYLLLWWIGSINFKEWMPNLSPESKTIFQHFVMCTKVR